MKTSKNGIKFIEDNEGIRLAPYLDSASNWTVGVGHLIRPTDSFPKSGVTNGVVQELFYEDAFGKHFHNLLAKPKWSLIPPEVSDLLVQDVGYVEYTLNAFLQRNRLDGISQNQFDSLVDFGFNTGASSLLKLLSHGLSEVPLQILKWDIAGGEINEGLKNRREREAKLFRTPDEPS